MDLGQVTHRPFPLDIEALAVVGKRVDNLAIVYRQFGLRDESMPNPLGKKGFRIASGASRCHGMALTRQPRADRFQIRDVCPIDGDDQRAAGGHDLGRQSVQESPVPQLKGGEAEPEHALFSGPALAVRREHPAGNPGRTALPAVAMHPDRQAVLRGTPRDGEPDDTAADDGEIHSGPACPRHFAAPFAGMTRINSLRRRGVSVRGVSHSAPLVRLASAKLYLCTDARRERDDLAEFAEAALAGGVDIIQLRDKGSLGEQRFGPLEARDELAALEILSDAARRHDALLAVNDRADIALAARSDILHLGQDDLPPPVARDILGDTILGRSTHDIDQVRAAMAPGPNSPDYFCVGPCWPTPTKPGRPAPGLELVRQARTIMDATGSDKPWFAIGGISPARVPDVLAAGARRIVVVRAITAADDPEAAARQLTELLSSRR